MERASPSQGEIFSYGRPYCAQLRTPRPGLATCPSARVDVGALLGAFAMELLDLLDIARLPRLVEPRFKRTVEAHDREPSSTRHRLNPVAFFAGGRLRTEVDVVGAVSVLLDSWTLAALRGKLLVALNHGSRLCIVNDHGPEVLGWRVGGYGQFVVLTTLEVVVF